MSLNDKAVITPGTGFVFTGSAGLARPTPAEIANIDPFTWGSKVYTLTRSGGTGGTFKFLAGSDEATVPYNANAAQVQTAIESLDGFGAGSVIVAGSGTDPLTITLTGPLQGVAGPTLTINSTGVTGGTPTFTLTVTSSPNGWSSVGHTSREEMPEFGFDGGDTEVRGTWQNAALREVQGEAPADFLLLQLHQFDNTGLGLYYGPNASNTPGVFGVAGGTSASNEKALLIVIVDGDVNLGFHAHKASFRRDDSIGLPNDGFAALPIRATFLKQGGNFLYSWINEDFFA